MRIKTSYIILHIAFVLLIARSYAQPYQAGEKLKYYIHYGLVNGGTASLQIIEDTIFGKEVLYAVMEGRTTGIADVLYKIRDYYHSYFDPETNLPLKAIRDIKEGRYTRYNELLFDHYSREDSAIIQSKLTGEHVTTKEIYDILSCFYLFREEYLAGDVEMEEEQITTILTWFTDEFYPIRLRFKGYETIKTKVGKINCLKFNPVTEVGRVFKTEDDMSIWFSNDENFLPVKIRFDIFVGSITIDMTDYEGLVAPLNIIK
ncbi:MAG TPA: DUF3108 domain-containing protein [Bacteroidales bacterium]|nr:DUF3108 domain-containing protein [Bacteroidales bacterium]